MERRESEACLSQHSLSVEEAREEDTQAGRRSILPAVPGHRASDELRKTSRAIPHSARALSWEGARGWISIGQESFPKGQSELRLEEEADAAVRPEVVLGRWDGWGKQGDSENLVRVRP